MGGISFTNPSRFPFDGSMGKYVADMRCMSDEWKLSTNIMAEYYINCLVLGWCPLFCPHCIRFVWFLWNHVCRRFWKASSERDGELFQKRKEKASRRTLVT